MEEKVKELRRQFQTDFAQVKQAKEVEQLKVKYLGKKGPIQELLMQLRDSSADERPRLGKLINDLKEELAHLCEEGLQGFE